VHKGTNPDIDSYSAFFDNKKLSHTDMEAFLRAKNVTDLYVCGIAYDVCVGKEGTTHHFGMQACCSAPICIT